MTDPSTPLRERARLDETASEALADWSAARYRESATTFDAEQCIARRLGARVEDAGRVAFGFWAPELLDRRVPDGDIFLELLAPTEPLDLEQWHQVTDFERLLLPVRRHESHVFAVVDGLCAGTRALVGDFYALCWRDGEGVEHRIVDPLAVSVPFGAFAPAEILDPADLERERGDRAYYEALAADGVHKFGPPVNILQLHVPTATAGGTLASLARQDPATEVPRIARPRLRGLGVEPHGSIDVFYADCAPEDAEWAASRLCVNPIRPLLARFRGDLGGVRRSYIECVDDRAVSIAWQRELARRAGVEIVASLPTSHSPFLSAPRDLARTLCEIVSRPTGGVGSVGEAAPLT